jgi:hypothetical protein
MMGYVGVVCKKAVEIRYIRRICESVNTRGHAKWSIVHGSLICPKSEVSIRKINLIEQGCEIISVEPYAL